VTSGACAEPDPYENGEKFRVPQKNPLPLDVGLRQIDRLSAAGEAGFIVGGDSHDPP